MKLKSISSLPTAVPKKRISATMGASKCYSLMKCLLIFFNIVFLAVGVGACALAGWALWVDLEAGAGAGGEDGRAARAGAAAWGAWGGALAAGAAAGLAGAARRSAPLLAGSFALLALCAVAEGAAACWGAQHTPQLHAALQSRLRHALSAEYSLQPAATRLLDAVQHQLECCGVEGARDWQESAWARARAAAVPASGVPSADLPGAGLPSASVLDTAAPLDLTVGAPPLRFAVPPSCCPEEEEGCRGGAGGAAWRAACGGRVLEALGRAARGPLLLGAALLAAHALLLLLTLALCLRAPPRKG